jgi:hypothetical protein
MQVKWRKLAAVAFASLFVGVFVGPALASPLHPNPKCNAGGGNGSETTPATDCDPGNSGGNNNGGD